MPPAPHIEDLVMLPTPVLRLLNVLDGDYLENEEEYEGQCCGARPRGRRVAQSPSFLGLRRGR